MRGPPARILPLEEAEVAWGDTRNLKKNDSHKWLKEMMVKIFPTGIGKVSEDRKG